MKNIILLAALATITACKPAPETAPPETAIPESAPADNQAQAASTAADGGPSPGQYRATDASGTVLLETLRPDGSYTFMDESQLVLEEGQWIQKSPAELCFTANTGNATEICYNEEVRSDGIWYSTRAGKNDTAIIERIEN